MEVEEVPKRFFFPFNDVSGAVLTDVRGKGRSYDGLVKPRI